LGLQIAVYLSLFRAVTMDRPALAGLLLAAPAAGGLFGSLVARTVFVRVPPAVVVCTHVLLWCLGFIVVGTVSGVWLCGVVLFCLWLSAPTFLTVSTSHRVAVIADESLGRVVAVTTVLSM